MSTDKINQWNTPNIDDRDETVYMREIDNRRSYRNLYYRLDNKKLRWSFRACKLITIKTSAGADVPVVFISMILVIFMSAIVCTTIEKVSSKNCMTHSVVK